ncbi:MAG: cation-translocating P-type ATPase, partial [Planctomycetota bacterium]
MRRLKEAAPVEDERQSPDWCALPADEACHLLGADPEGLTEEEAAKRLKHYGVNRLPSRPPVSLGVIVVRQFRSPLIYILGAAAVLAISIGEFTDAGFIVGVLCLNALIGAFQEYRAEKSSQALQQLLQIHATVERDGREREIEAARIVPGDIVWLESGDRVPADARLIKTYGFEIDESVVTGESLPVDKSSEWIGGDNVAQADQKNMAWAGTVVTLGRAKAVVVATGSRTQVGMLAVDVMSAESGKPPLVVRLERFTKGIGAAVIVAGLVLIAVGVVVRGESLSTMMLVGVALVVSAIPEGMPVAITVALSIATTRMARLGVIVRQLGAVEGLGSCTLIASDKTGTLTCNEMTVRRIVLASGTECEVTGEGYSPNGEVRMDGDAPDDQARSSLWRLARAVALCNEATLHPCDGVQTWRGDPTDVALLSFGQKAGAERDRLLEDHPPVTHIPFNPDQQYAAAFHESPEGCRVFVKGAPERVLKMCEQGLTTEDLERIRRAAERMAQQGLRVLGAAEGPLDEDAARLARLPDDGSLTYLGLMGMIDPLRPGAREAVATCRRSGLRVCMVTGDHPVTAQAIAQDLGLIEPGGEALTGSQVEAMTDARLEKSLEDVSVFARVAPHQKLRIVEAAQRLGHFVAVTGDGVNDAPALQKANIGVAMGRSGTDVARDASDLVISDDDFSTIVVGIEQGRIAYQNVRNVIFLLISTGAAEVLLVLMSVFGGYPVPLLPVQLLWLNLVTNGIQDVALAFEPGQGNEIKFKPRSPTESIFNPLMIHRTLISATVMGVVAFGLFVWMIESGYPLETVRNHMLLLMVLFENVHIGNCRSETISALRLSPLRSPILIVGAL